MNKDTLSNMEPPKPQTFNHPYSPYDIQVRFMQSLYECLEEGKVAIFESPTGSAPRIQIIELSCAD